MTKDQSITVYMTEETKQKIKEQAQTEGLSPTVWMRHKAKKALPAEATV